MDDKSVLSKLTQAPALIRFQSLVGGDEVGSATLANYLQRFNSLSTKIADIALKIDAIEHPKSDQKGEQQAELQQNAGNLSSLKAEMKSLMEERDEPRLEELKKSWENYKNSNFKDDIEFAFQNFMLITEKFSEGLKAFNLSYLKNPNDYQQNLGNLFNQTQNIIMSPDNEAEDIQKSTQSFEQTNGIAKMTTLQKNMQALHSLMKTAGLDVSDISIMINTEGVESLEELLPGDKMSIKRIADSIGEYFDENSFTEKENETQINIAKIVKYSILASGKCLKQYHNDFKYTKLFNNNEIFVDYVTNEIPELKKK